MIVTHKPYRYVKHTGTTRTTFFGIPAGLSKRLLALLLVGTGLVTLGSVVSPIVGFQLFDAKAEELVFPLDATDPNGLVLSAQTASTGQIVQVRRLADGFSYFASTKVPRRIPTKEFTLAIPKIGISNALVIVDSNDFDKNLGHLPQTALPGEVGNVFITGHSAVSRFFSATNYKTMFTSLPKLALFDEIELKSRGTTHRYSVEKRTVVEPTEVSVIEPPDPFGKYLTLMTCVPPGLNTKRLIVLARLVE